MRLDVWLVLKKISHKEFADKVGIAPTYFSAIVNGHRNPGLKLAKKIEELTNGEVSRLELLYPEEYQENSKTKK